MLKQAKITILDIDDTPIAFINYELIHNELRIFVHKPTELGIEYKPLGYVLGSNCLILKIED